MGQVTTKGLSDQDLDQIRQSTHFTLKEVSEWHDRFYGEYPEGTISPERFTNMYVQMFPGGDARELARHIFRAYDIDTNGIIDFNEFMCTLSVAARGTPDQKLTWTFNLYDCNRDGFISRKEAAEIIKAIYKMQGEDQIREKTQDTVAELFVRLDSNKDSRLSKAEFVYGARKCTNIMDILNANQ